MDLRHRIKRSMDASSYDHPKPKPPMSKIQTAPYLSRHDHAITTAHAVLAPVSRGCPPLKGRLSMHYSPFRHSNKVHLLPRSPVRVRLACLIHAANVRSEPGSNPSIFCSISPPGRAGRSFKIESSHPCGICQRITPPAKTLGIAHNGFVQNRGTQFRCWMLDSRYPTSRFVAEPLSHKTPEPASSI